MTSICLSDESGKGQKNVCCHLLPCKIDYNGPTRVSDYFTPYIRGTDDHLQCSLRGRPLCGQKVKVPNDYIGVILKDNKNVSLSEGEKDLKAVATFDEFTAWNWDLVPSANDKLVRALEWIEVANALHSPDTSWNWDLVSSANDKLVRALEWVKVANALHSPVSEHASMGKGGNEMEA
ncbi:hypothetical protein JTE90_017841 [Oedothorax gibbosus]|uniref:Uncharacterized protein n=1 Tax=Oedothorax gibbosus TaxID=931172 RepID=A0AAV6V8R2_9ARAC|nr:hypothetical protein JTE90_017841 [Oedothorax gibbosus]